jgi:hypothetical protein
MRGSADIDDSIASTRHHLSEAIACACLLWTATWLTSLVCRVASNMQAPQLHKGDVGYSLCHKTTHADDQNNGLRKSSRAP